MPTETTTVHAIGRCPVKGCRTRRRHTFPGTIIRERLRTWTSWSMPTEDGGQHPQPTIGGPNVSFTALVSYALRNHPRDAVPYGTEASWLIMYAEAMLSHGRVCLDHDRFCKVNTVQGVLRVDKGCNGRCEAATGPDCECSCAGRNHGGAYDTAPTII